MKSGQRSRNEEGTATAEFAFALPALAVVTVLAVGLLNHSTQVNVLQSDLAQYARALARNESEFRVRGWFSERHPKVRVEKTQNSGALCLKIRIEALIPPNEVEHCVWLGDY